MTTTAPAVLTEVDTVDEQGEAILVILKMLTIVGSFNNVDYVDKRKIEKICIFGNCSNQDYQGQEGDETGMKMKCMIM